jgi:hypothetical protein
MAFPTTARLATALFLACIAPAKAVPMQAVYTGTIFGSADETQLFGAGTNLDGQSYSLAFFYDPETPGSTRVTTPASDTVQGGTSLAILTIAGHAEHIAASFFGLASNSANYFTEHDARDISFDGIHYTDSYVFNTASDLDFTTPIDLQTAFATSLSNGYGSGYFGLFSTDVSLNQTITRAYGNMNPTSLTVSRVSAVPIPGSLPLLAAALGFCSLQSRRRKAFDR